MRITVLTVCPEVFDSFEESVLVKRARERGLLDLNITDIRNYAGGSFRHTDDSVYGGGAGMILKCAPVLKALQAVRTEHSHTVLFTPSGSVYDQKKVHAFAEMEDLVLIAGHYEGFDARILEEADEENISSMRDAVREGLRNIEFDGNWLECYEAWKIEERNQFDALLIIKDPFNLACAGDREEFDFVRRQF